MWTVISTQDEATWLDDLIRDVITYELPPLPPHDQKIGHVEAHWHQIGTGLAYVAVNPDTGTPADRRLVEAMVMEQLRLHGFRRAVTEMYPTDMTRTATWQDIMDKARRLIQSGNVTILRNSANTVIGRVVGDGTDNDGKPDTHKCEISREDPNSQAITGSFCDCGWGDFQNLPRTRIWKRFQNRPCSHILATYWVSKAMPLDEDRAPGNTPPEMGGQGGQMSLFDMSGGQAPNTMGVMQGVVPPNAWFNQPMGLAQAPPPESVLPQFPMEDQMQTQLPPINPASVPGGRPGPTPTNPIQYPGGTFSSYNPGRLHYAMDQQFANGQMVRTLEEDVGNYVGRPESGMAGQPATIPRGAVCEVLGTDPSTGMVNVLWMGKSLDEMSYFQPFGIQAWFWPSQIKAAPDVRPPGPAIRRR